MQRCNTKKEVFKGRGAGEPGFLSWSFQGEENSNWRKAKGGSRKQASRNYLPLLPGKSEAGGYL